MMTKRLLLGALLVMMAALSVHDFVVMAQAVVTPPGEFIPAAQWRKILDDDKPALGIVAGQRAQIVEPFVIRRRIDGPNNASVHTKEGDGQNVTEVYYILEGSGTYTTGGTLPDPNNRTAGIKGGQTNDIKPGDVIIIPPGTAHWFSKINDHVTYIEARFPGNVLDPPAK
jgi:mannose-6-phosphate isomerase-like protein (cupin superfamily)